MWAGLIKGALKQRILVALGAVALAIWGANAYRQLSIDAFPDVAPTQVLVSMRAPGLTPEELESRITQPIELAVRGIPNLVKMRSTTRYSVALLTFDFADGTDIFWARAQVNERLSDVRDQLPAGADGGLAPIVTPLAEMVMFTIESEMLTPQEKRFLVDWTIRPALRGLPGVADVNVLGGFVRTFEVVPSRQPWPRAELRPNCWKTRSGPITAMTAQGASATARRRYWFGRKAAFGRSTISAISSSRRANPPLSGSAIWRMFGSARSPAMAW
jgi:Cu/Ag efflux pump CusA